MLILPQRQDQYFNAHAVLSLGVGAAVTWSRTTGAGLAEILLRRALTPACKKTARRISAKLRNEDGVVNACRRIERLL
jgi:UDP:flavonoid glycosyltransferase YjiC (YdhE family)